MIFCHFVHFDKNCEKLNPPGEPARRGHLKRLFLFVTAFYHITKFAAVQVKNETQIDMQRRFSVIQDVSTGVVTVS